MIKGSWPTRSVYIVFVSSYWQFPEVAWELLGKLSREGYRITMLICDVPVYIYSGRIVDQAKRIAICRLSYLDPFRSILGTPYPLPLGMGELLEKLRPDIVHIQSHLSLSSILGMSCSRRLRTPVVPTIHRIRAMRGSAVTLAQEISFPATSGPLGAPGPGLLQLNQRA